MALDRKNIEFLQVNTLPSFSSWEITTGGASVLADTATLPPQSTVAHSLNPDYNSGLSPSEYRKLTLTINTKPSIESNYTAFQQVRVNLHIVYGANTNSQVNEVDVEITLNEDDIIENTNNTYTLQRIINTNSKIMQTLIVTISNTGLNTVTVSDARLQRSADINTEEILNELTQTRDQMNPKAFNFYIPVEDILNGLGVVVVSGAEYKYKPDRIGNLLNQIETNFSDPMPCVYLKKPIDLTTSDPGNAES